MSTSTIVKRGSKARMSLAQVIEHATTFAALAAQGTVLARKTDVEKGVLRQALDSPLATVDEKGNRWIEFDEPIRSLKGLKHERRSKKEIDSERAEKILTDKGVYDDCVEVSVSIDSDKIELVYAALRKAGIYDEVVNTSESYLSEDKIMQKWSAGVLTDDDVDDMFTENVTWAFVPQWIKAR